MNNQFFYIIIYSAFFFSLLLIILFLYLMVRKAIENNRLRKVFHIQQSCHRSLFDYLYNGVFSRNLVPINKYKFKAIEDLLIRIGVMVNSDAVNKRISVYTEKYFKNRYERYLKSSRWSKRMNTLYNIEDFHMEVLSSAILSLYNKKKVTIDEKVQILRCLAKFNAPKFLYLLRKDKLNISKYLYKEILSLATENTLLQLIKDNQLLNKQLQLAIILLIGENHLIDNLQYVEEYLDHEDEAFRIEALQALSKIGVVTSSENLLPFLKSKIWEERALTCKIYGVLKEQHHLPTLVKMLGDKTWGVRLEAGRAIRKFRNYQNIFSNVLQKSEDHFACDMAKQWLSSRSL